MRFLKKPIPFLFLAIVLASCKNKETTEEPVTEMTGPAYYAEPYRPQFHFSPEKMWMNDPNGMVYHQGVYHLFYQYYPDDIVWGPMHWGHATSKDLVRWEHQPIALYPDSLGYIFSGSAVLDKKNTSGFGTKANPPLVAIFTYHNAEMKEAGKTSFETQGIAYSLDKGHTWEKYDDNPVISDKNSTDFRDPKVMWHEPSQKWVLTLVAGDHAEFYGSKDLKTWELLSEFGKGRGAQDSVWECPDLFKLKVEGSDEEKWILLISLGDAPNGGSGTQYFIGDFDGSTFASDQAETRWVDWGTDNYAGVTYSNTPNDEKIFIGWMSNWIYANKTPTEKWRSAMTLPRKLSLKKIGDPYELTNYPIENLEAIIDLELQKEIELDAGMNESIYFDHFNRSETRFATASKNFLLAFKNEKNEKLVLTMDGEKNRFLLDRTESGQTDFQKDFAIVAKMPVDNLPEGVYEVRILMDRSSVEVFINKGQYVMTAQIFPNGTYGTLEIENTGKKPLEFTNFQVNRVKGIW